MVCIAQKKIITFRLTSSSDLQDCHSWAGENHISWPFLQPTLTDFFKVNSVIYRVFSPPKLTPNSVSSLFQ